MKILRASLNLSYINKAKFVSRVVTIVLTALLVLGILFQMPIAKADTWRGTAPFCEGECLPGEQIVQKSNCGNGGCCWTGSKVLCRNSEPTCQGNQVNAACYGVVEICDNGFYEGPFWHSCSKYACGPCFGLGKK